MAIDKNFVIKNGLEVNTNVLVAAADEKQVGIGTTRPYYKLHVGGGEGSRGGIGATDITISGIATLGVGNSSQGALKVVGISTFDGDVDLLGSAGVSTVLWDASENRLEFKDNASVGFGTGNDLTLWHDGSVSYIKDTVGDLRIAGDKITLEIEDGTDVKVIDQFGVNITGVTTTNRLYVSGISTFMDDVDFDSQVRFDESEKALTFVDGAAIRVGTGSDFSIMHDGSHTIMRDTGTGGLYLMGSSITITGAAGGSETLADFVDGGKAALYYDNVEKLSTVSIGATVFGDLVVAGVTTAEALKVTGVSTFTGIIDGNGGANISGGSGLVASTVKVSDLTDNRVVIAGSSGEIEDDANLTFDGTKLNVGSGVTIQPHGGVSIAGILTVGGNLYVTGDIVYDEVTGRNLNITGITTLADQVNFGTSGIGATIYKNGNMTVSGILTASSIGLKAAPGGTPNTKNAFFAIGDSDTGIVQDGDGQLELWSNDTEVANLGSIDGYTSTLPIVTTSNGSIKTLTVRPDGRVSVASSLAVTGIATVGILSVTENARIAGIVTADRFIGIHTSTDGGGIGIGSTTAHVGYGITYLNFKGPGVSTVYYSSVTGVSTVYFQGGGSSVGAAGTWQNDGTQGISTAKSVGINTVGVAVTALMGGEKGASSGIGASMQGLYIGNGMMINDNQLNGNHYIGTAFGGIMAGPVTVNGVVTVDGNWAVV